MLFMSVWKVAGASQRPVCITEYWSFLYLLSKAVLSESYGCVRIWWNLVARSSFENTSEPPRLSNISSVGVRESFSAMYFCWALGIQRPLSAYFISLPKNKAAPWGDLLEQIFSFCHRWTVTLLRQAAPVETLRLEVDLAASIHFTPQWHDPPLYWVKVPMVDSLKKSRQVFVCNRSRSLSVLLRFLLSLILSFSLFSTTWHIWKLYLCSRLGINDLNFFTPQLEISTSADAEIGRVESLMAATVKASSE